MDKTLLHLALKYLVTQGQNKIAYVVPEGVYSVTIKLEPHINSIRGTNFDVAIIDEMK